MTVIELIDRLVTDLKLGVVWKAVGGNRRHAAYHLLASPVGGLLDELIAREVVLEPVDKLDAVI